MKKGHYCSPVLFSSVVRVHAGLNRFLLICLAVFCVACSQKTPLTAQSVLSAASLQQQIKAGQPIVLRNKTIEGDVYFTKAGTIVPLNPDLQQAIIAAPIYFDNCSFTGKVVAYEQEKERAFNTRFTSVINFYNCRFEKAVDLQNALFDQGVAFNKSLFKAAVNLQAIKINGDLSMEAAVFNSGAQFQESVIRGMFWARDAVINGQFSLQQADIWQQAFFAGIAIHGYADFGQTFFRQSAFFEYGKYYDRVNFSGTVFQHRAEWNLTQFEKAVDMSNAWFVLRPVFIGIKNKELFNQTGARFDGGAPEWK